MANITKRIMVDMSATLIHHGHIRLLEHASKYGNVIVGLTTDEEIYSKKGYKPEISFDQRKEILESIKYVSQVVATPWLIDEQILDRHNIDLLVHGDDNSNNIKDERLLIFPRTKGVSSSDIRLNCSKAIMSIKNKKLMLTPGPAAVLHENLEFLKPVFGRGDEEYQMMSEGVIEWIKGLSGQDQVVMSQGSSTFSLELAARSFVRGKVLLISTGYYSARLKTLLPKECDVFECNYEELENITGKFDWVMCAYTETSTAFKVDLQLIKEISCKTKSKLYVDATGSIGLEDNHHLADVMAFSSCKGLFGLTGASFIAHKNNLSIIPTNHFYFNMETQIKKMVTGPYHAVCSLYGVMQIHSQLKDRVALSKQHALTKWKDFTRGNSNQPLLCTYLEGQVSALDKDVVLYSPRSELTGSVICHLGEIHSNELKFTSRIKIN